MRQHITPEQAQAAAQLIGRIYVATGGDIECEAAHVDGEGGWFLHCFDTRRHTYLTVTSFEDFIEQRPQYAEQGALPLSY